jgi:uncharacterized protein
MDLFTALTIGIIGSIHCIGMCGPIAVALPFGNRHLGGKATGALLYNTGRTLTYGLLGAFFGLLGKGVQLAGFQQWVSIIIGIIMVVSVIFPLLFRERISPGNILFRYSGRLINNLRVLFGRKSYSNLFMIGLLNGLLPCGLVYVAVAGAINTGDVLPAILFMIVFGAATTPVMMGVSLAGNMAGTRIRLKLNKILPAFIIILGLIFILRGLSLGIPYVSPKAEKLTPVKEITVKGACCENG